jgi:acetyl esterase
MKTQQSGDVLPSGFALPCFALVLAAGGLIAVSQVVAAKENKSKVDYSALQPRARAFVESLNGPPIYTLSVEEARAFLNEVQEWPVAKMPPDVEGRSFPVGPGKDTSVQIVRPKPSPKGPLPVVMYFHGGGWILGNKDTHDRLIREIANGSQAAVVFVNYTPSPEAHYPIAIEQAYAATRFVAEEGASLGLDGSRLAVAGDGVGGNLAAVTTLLAKQRGGPKIVFQALFYPVTDASFDTGSYKQFAKGWFLERAEMKWFWEAYAPDHSVWKEITVSPLRASIEQLRGLPPALVITDENDLLRDEGEAYAHKLAAAGVAVTATRYRGTIHDFMMLNALTDDPAPRAAIAQTSAVLGAALGQAGTQADTLSASTKVSQ